MQNTRATAKKNIGIFLLAALLVWLLGLLPLPDFGIFGLAGIGYSGILIAWVCSVWERILDRATRDYMIAGGILLTALFVLRMCRYSIFSDGGAAGRLAWYGYYVPFLAVPMCAFSVALYAESPPDPGEKRLLAGLWIFDALLCLLVLTNDVHQRTFVLTPLTKELQTYGPVYFAVVTWCIALTLAGFALLLQRCRLSKSRRRWYVPLLSVFPGAALVLLYFKVGGAPAIGGIKLYNLQEAYGFLYVCFFESCVQIGLLPSNTGYGQIFERSKIEACIASEDGEIVYKAQDMQLPAQEMLQSAKQNPVDLPGGLRLLSAPISGGRVYWKEDLSGVNRILEELREAADRLAEENTLQEYENDAQRERAKLAFQNRFYDQIALDLDPWLKRLKNLLDEADDAADPRPAFSQACVLGAYIKRVANLSILSMNAGQLDTDELRLSIRESLEYARFAGVAADLRTKGKTRVPAHVVLGLYEWFEAVLERAAEGGHSLMVNLQCGGDPSKNTPPSLSQVPGHQEHPASSAASPNPAPLRLILMTDIPFHGDAPAAGPLSPQKKSPLAFPGMEVSYRQEEGISWLTAVYTPDVSEGRFGSSEDAMAGSSDVSNPSGGSL